MSDEKLKTDEITDQPTILMVFDSEADRLEFISRYTNQGEQEINIYASPDDKSAPYPENWFKMKMTVDDEDVW
jgi:hypothetical protein